MVSKIYKMNESCEAHSLVVNCNDIPGKIGQMKALLSPSELERADAFHFEHDSRRYISAHAMLRKVLSDCTGKQPQDLEFREGPFGKPYLSNHRHIRFNLSHSKDLIAVAVTLNREIGVDVEKCVPFDGITNMAKRTMTDKEYQRFLDLDKTRQTQFFYTCWVRKEAIVKSWGKGVDDDLCNIPVMENHSSDKDKIICSFHGNIWKTWRVEDIQIGNGYVGALSIEQDTNSKPTLKTRGKEAGQPADSPALNAG